MTFTRRDWAAKLYETLLDQLKDDNNAVTQGKYHGPVSEATSSNSVAERTLPLRRTAPSTIEGEHVVYRDLIAAR